MIPERVYTRPNVAPRYYCSHCGNQLQDDTNPKWKHCPICGKEIEWNNAREINLREVKCGVCQKPLIYWKNGAMEASPSFCNSNVCRECRITHCAQTNCLACKDGEYPHCQWAYLKRLASAMEVEL